MGLAVVDEKQISGLGIVGNAVDDLAAGTGGNKDQLREFMGVWLAEKVPRIAAYDVDIFLGPLHFLSIAVVGADTIRPLCRRVQHIFNKNAISGSRVVNKDMSNGADQFSVPDDGNAGRANAK